MRRSNAAGGGTAAARAWGARTPLVVDIDLRANKREELEHAFHRGCGVAQWSDGDGGWKSDRHVPPRDNDRALRHNEKMSPHASKEHRVDGGVRVQSRRRRDDERNAAPAGAQCDALVRVTIASCSACGARAAETRARTGVESMGCADAVGAGFDSLRLGACGARASNSKWHGAVPIGQEHEQSSCAEIERASNERAPTSTSKPRLTSRH